MTTTTSAFVEEYGTEGLVMMMGALAENSLKIMRPRERRLDMSQRCYADRPEGLNAMTYASEEEYESKDLTATTGPRNR